MKFTWKREYKSIKGLRLPCIEFPDFVLLTGANGSGKTHFLESIRDGHTDVYIDGDVIPLKEITAIAFGTLSVGGQDSYGSQSANSLCDQIFQNLNTWRQKFQKQYAISFTGTHKPDAEKQGFLQYLENQNNAGSNKIISAIRHVLSSESDTGLSEISRQHIWMHLFNSEASNAQEVNLFEQNFAKLFADYQANLAKLYKYQFIRQKGQDAPKVDKDKLSTLEQNKPWDFVNQVLETAGFHFAVEPPDFWDTEQFEYRIRLRNKQTEDTVSIQDLSTGERVLFALALVRYKAERQTKVFPKLILLDEPDAPLHPQMSQGLIDVITGIFVEQYKTRIVMSTHAPATVALSPKDSIYVVRPEAKPERLTSFTHTTKQEALNVLSSGFIAYSGDEMKSRIRIDIQEAGNKPLLFVEGPTDKHIIQVAWQKIRLDTELPFRIIDCGNANQVSQIIRAINIEHLHEKNMAIFDFDKEGYNLWNGLAELQYDGVHGMENEGLYRTRKDKTRQVVAMLLPVPSHRTDYANRKNLGDVSSLPIEMMFEDDVLEEGNNLGKMLLPGGNSIKVFRGNKTGFAKKAESFQAQTFRPFAKLFEAIAKHLEI